jgi:predicted acetyltransferase
VADVVIADPRDEADLERFAAADAESFGQSRDHVLKWLNVARSRTRIRIARSGDDVLGGYVLISVGQWFGGFAVSAHAVAAVSVHPAWRRRGVATSLMRDLVNVAREHGAALAPLYAATTRFYRRWGWEIGDRSYEQKVDAKALAPFTGAGQVVRNPAHADVEALRRSVLWRFDGPLDRPDWWLALEWDTAEPEERHFLYGWVEGGELTGVVRYVQQRSPDPAWMVIAVYELVARTKDALHGLLGLLGGNEAQVRDVVFKHSTLQPRPELLYLVPDADQHISAKGFICWMQRIVDIPNALRARGWNPNVSATVALEVADPFNESPQRMVLEVAGGKAEVTPGGSGAVTCGVGALGAWYSGTLRAWNAAKLELMRGSAEDIALMDSLLVDNDPWMPDYF